MRGRLLLVSTLLATALIAVPASGGGPSAPTPSGGARAEAVTSSTPAARAQAALRRLVADTRRLPAKTNARVKPGLVSTALVASRSFRASPCRSIRTLASYRSQLPRARGSHGGVSWHSILAADAFSGDAALKTMARAKGCGGAARPPAERLTVEVLASDETGVKLRVTLPLARFVPEENRGRAFTQMLMDDMTNTGEPGEPGVPAATKLFAVPPESQVVAKVSNVSSYVLDGVTLLPRQNDPLDQVPPREGPSSFDLDPPFVFDAKAYRSSQPFPSTAAEGRELGTMRDLRIGGVELQGGQYRPRLKRLRVFTAMDIEITFAGANRAFADSRLTSAFNAAFDRIYRSTLLNYEIVLRNPDLVVYPFCGEELLIVTTPALRPAADTLAASRTAAGYLTSVREVGSGPGQIGTTKEQIQTYIRGRLNGGCLVRPSYLILLGNTAHVPTFLVPCGPGGDPAECNIASDLPYALDGVGSDLFADLAYGRIPAPDLATATTVVNKIVTYETTAPAPSGDSFYSTATVTSFFEPTYKCVPEGESCGAGGAGHWELDTAVTRDARGFTKTTERVRNGMRADGYAVERIYTTEPTVNPLEYYDGTSIPAELRRPTFAWDGDTSDFVSAFNSGRFLVFHRDHGWPGGWAHPYLTNGDIPSLTNGVRLPVVFGVNCASGRFDEPADPSFVERLLQKPDGGAVGGFGDSRNSPTWPNNNMALGFFDALFPLVVPSYGADEPLVRMGDVLLAGKQYMESVEGAGSGGAYVEHYLYTYFGDPTMQLWIAEPVRFDPSRIKIVYEKIPFPEPGDPPFRVRVQLTQPLVENTMVTLEYQGVPVGRAFVRNGEAVVEPMGKAGERGLSISLEQDGFIPASRPVSPG